MWPVAALRIDRRRRSPRRRGAVHSRPSGKLSCQCANLTELSAVAGWVFYASGAVRLTPRGAGCPGGSAGCPVGAARAGIDLRRCRLVITSTPYVSARRQWPLGQTAGAVSAWSDGSMVCSAVRGGTSPRSMLCAVYPRYCGGTALGGSLDGSNDCTLTRERCLQQHFLCAGASLCFLRTSLCLDNRECVCTPSIMRKYRANYS